MVLHQSVTDVSMGHIAIPSNAVQGLTISWTMLNLFPGAIEFLLQERHLRTMLPARSAEMEDRAGGHESDGYEPGTPLPFSVGEPEELEPPELDIFDGPDYNSKLDSARALIASGKKISDLVEKCERGHAAIASIFTGAIEHGGAEETSLSARLAKAMAALPKPKVRNRREKATPHGLLSFVVQSTARLVS